MMNIKFLAVLKTQSNYHGCFIQKTFWEEIFTGEKKLFSAVKKKNGGRHNVRKHMEIKINNKYVTLNISLKFDSLDKMKIISLESKENWKYQERG